MAHLVNNLLKGGLLLVILASLGACHSQQGDELSFPKVVTMDKWIANPSLFDCFDPWEVQVNDSLLFICEPKTAYPFVKIYDTRNFQQVGAFGQQGNGPNEFLNSCFIQIDKNHNMLWFVDFPTHTFHGFAFRDILNNNKAPLPIRSVQFDPMLLPVYNFSVMQDTSILLPTGICNSLLSVVDRKGRIADSLGVSPDKRTPIPSIAFNNFYYKYTVYSAERKKAISAYRYFDKIILVDLELNKTKQLLGEDYKEQMPDIRGEGNIANNHIGYFRLKESGDCLYALYMGGDYHNQDITRNYPHEIQVFDWDLKPLVKLTFPDPIIDFAVKDSMLYLLVANRPNPLLVYQLDKKAW